MFVVLSDEFIILHKDSVLRWASLLCHISRLLVGSRRKECLCAVRRLSLLGRVKSTSGSIRWVGGLVVRFDEGIEFISTPAPDRVVIRASWSSFAASAVHLYKLSFMRATMIVLDVLSLTVQEPSAMVICHPLLSKRGREKRESRKVGTYNAEIWKRLLRIILP